MIIYDLKRIIDHNFEDYARHFQQAAVTASFVGEVAATSLSAVATLVGTDLKDALTTASTLTQATSVSVQKNYFQQQSAYAILAQMDAERLDKWSHITDSMKMNDIDSYSLNAALHDLQEYKRLGTAVAALTAIVQQAGATSTEASKNINKPPGSNPPKSNP